ncbi:unnamed protein product [Auanema sp. JU1783]|nr:unnamed protein product [Auanema sp. JU1783]
MNESGEISDQPVDRLRTIRVELSALLVAEANPISVDQIQRRYEEEIGVPLDPTNYGYSSTDDLLAALTDKVVAVTVQGRRLYRTKFSREFQDLQKMVQCQTTKEERRMNTLRRDKTRTSQFGSKFKSNYIQTGGFETSSCAQYNPLYYQMQRPPPPVTSRIQPLNLISSVYAAVKRHGFVNSDGYLSISIVSLMDIMKDDLPTGPDRFGVFCDMLRASEFLPHWRLEVTYLNQNLEHILIMNAHIKRELPEVKLEVKVSGQQRDVSLGPHRVLSKDGKRLAINSLRSALWFNKRQSESTSKTSTTLDDSRSDITTSVCSTVDMMDKLVISEEKKNQPYKLNSIEEAVSRHPIVYNKSANSPDNQTMNNRSNLLASRCDLGGFSQNIIQPIQKEDSEVYKQIEQLDEPVRGLSSRFAGPSSSRSSFSGRIASPSFGSHAPMDHLDRRPNYPREHTPISSRLSNQSDKPPMHIQTPLSASKALERMNAIDNEMRQSANEMHARRLEEARQNMYNGITEKHLSKFKSFKFVQDPNIDDITMCAPMYFVPPCSVLICFESGNEDSCARFCEIQHRLQVYYSKQVFEKLKSADLGTVCIARSADSNEYARVVLVDIKGDSITGACLDYHGFVTADTEALAVLPDIFSPQYLPCNTFLARFNGIQSLCQTTYKAVSENIAERSTESNEFILFTTAIFGVDPVDDKIVVDWVTSEGCWKSAELTQKFNAKPRSSDPRHPTADEVDKATEELEVAAHPHIELKWFFSDSENMLKKQVEILQTMCANYDRPETSSSIEHDKEEEEVQNTLERSENVPNVEKHASRAHTPVSSKNTCESVTKTKPLEQDTKQTPIESNSIDFGEEHVEQLGILMRALSRKLYREVRPTLKCLVGGIAELAKNACSNADIDKKCWDSMVDSLK